MQRMSYEYKKIIYFKIVLLSNEVSDFKIDFYKKNATNHVLKENRPKLLFSVFVKNITYNRHFFCIFDFLPVNVAQNKPAYQEYQWDDGNTISDASNAVDGNKSKLNLAGGQCVISASSKQTAIWWVNLINIQRIHHITIYYRTENITWGT